VFGIVLTYLWLIHHFWLREVPNEELEHQLSAVAVDENVTPAAVSLTLDAPFREHNVSALRAIHCVWFAHRFFDGHSEWKSRCCWCGPKLSGERVVDQDF